jgi:ankyrin repeat protein
LHLALFYNQSEEVVLTLLNKYPIAATISVQSFYPLLTAIQKSHTERVVQQLILVYPQAIKECDRWDSYPFRDACTYWGAYAQGNACINTHTCKSKFSNNIILQLLYAFPQVAKYFSYNFGYPLHTAMRFKQSDRVVLILLNYNLLAVKSVQDYIDESPLDFAEANGYSEQIVNVIKTLMNKSDNELENCINIPKIVLLHTVDNVLRYDTIQWLLWNTPVKIKGQYVQQSTLLFCVEKTSI